MNHRPVFLHRTLIYFFIIVVAVSCSISGPSGIFGKKSAHEVYADKIKQAGLQGTAMGKQWFEAAEQSLLNPLFITLPYSETGYFPAEEPKAAGLMFNAKRGEKITVTITKKPATGFAVYADLWLPADSNSTAKPRLLTSADTASSTLTYNVNHDENYVFRLQPELLKGGEYTLTILNGPSLAFPIAPKVKSSIGSFWGAGRDNGERKHEGIDIFAPKRSPAVAAANGTVTRVNENVLGGKVVFLNPDNENYSLYYAHLDTQLVHSGQRLNTGDTLGLTGNTGNAAHTASHLHFGIYTNQGAIDPLPFVNPATQFPQKITAPLQNIDKWVRNNKTVRLLIEPSSALKDGITIEPNTLLKVEAATGRWYKVALPDGNEGYIPGNIVSDASAAIRNINIKTAQPLLDEPDSIAARKIILPPGSTVKILAAYKNFYFVNTESREEGWLPKKVLPVKL